ncbi:MAG: PP2C family serine/threonine-protein phosphatase [Lentisphaeria bacterium]|jgi:protein phosphatase
MDFTHLDSVALTDPGRVRTNNEDAILAVRAAGLFALADGMGGAAAGELASAIAAEELAQAFADSAPPPAGAGPLARVRQAVQALNQASRRIREYADQQLLSGTGTTAVVLLFDSWDPAQAMVLHAGDSRAYRWRKGTLERLTADHTVAAAAGVEDEAKLPPAFRGVLTRAVGLEPVVMLEHTPTDVQPGDLFLLCSDGLTKMLPDKQLQKLLRKLGRGALPDLAAALVAAANAAGGKDNVSVVLIRAAQELPAAYRPTAAERAADETPAAETAAAAATAEATPDTATPDTDEFHNRPPPAAGT